MRPWRPPIAGVAKNPFDLAGTSVKFQNTILGPQRQHDGVITRVIKHRVGVAPIIAVGKSQLAPIARAAAIAQPIRVKHIEQMPFIDDGALRRDFEHNIADDICRAARRVWVGVVLRPIRQLAHLCTQQ